jgi:general secretion pathway protein K
MPMRDSPRHRLRHATPGGQRGAALLTAMIIVTLVATLAAAMVWQQWRAVQVEAAERARTQAAWILSGALDFAKLILREDLRSGHVTALTEPWATPLAESRLSTFLAVDKSNADDGPEAFLSGNITDAQARYNLTNLVSTGKIDPAELATLERLCQTVRIDVNIATLIANGLLEATVGTGASAPLKPVSVAQLTWLGVDDASVQALQPYVVLLPVATPINVNTASNEVLVAAINRLDNATAEHLLQVRQRTPFKTLQDFSGQIPALAPLTAKLDVRSSYFEVRGRLRLVDRVLVERSLLQRLPSGQFNVLQRERIASLEQLSG